MFKFEIGGELQKTPAETEDEDDILGIIVKEDDFFNIRSPYITFKFTSFDAEDPSGPELLKRLTMLLGITLMNQN